MSRGRLRDPERRVGYPVPPRVAGFEFRGAWMPPPLAERTAMRSDTRHGTFEDVIDGVGDDLVAISRRLRALIKAAHPDVVEVPRPGERTVAYGFGPKKTSEAYAYIAPQSRWVNLGFYHGASLRDPDALLEGTGKALRHVKVRSGADADLPALGKLVKAALLERRTALQKAAEQAGETGAS